MAVDTCRSSPAKRGKAVEGARAGRAVDAFHEAYGAVVRTIPSRRARGAPSTMLRMVPLPRFAGEDLLPSCRTLGRPDAKHDIDEQGGVEDEAGGDGREEAGDAEVEPVHRGEPGAGADEEARRVGAHRPEAAAEALADEEQPES